MIKKLQYKTMFGFNNFFFALLTSVDNASNHTKFASWNNKQRMTQSTLINLQPNECSQAYTTIQFHLI